MAHQHEWVSEEGLTHYRSFRRLSSRQSLAQQKLAAKSVRAHKKVMSYVPPTDTGSLCLAVDSTHTAVPGLFRLLVRRSGTHCQMNSEIRRVMSTASNSSLKQCFCVFTGVTSALEVLFNIKRYITFVFTYLLTMFTMTHKINTTSVQNQFYNKKNLSKSLL